MLNEERSLAFVLIDEGYDVWVGNNRSTAGLGHTSLSYKDPEYWNWGLKELGIYDFPALIDHVRLYSGFPKVCTCLYHLRFTHVTLKINIRLRILAIHKEMLKYLLVYPYCQN